LVRAERFDRLYKLEPVAVDLDPRLLSDCFGDIGGRDRPEQFSFGTSTHWQTYHVLHQAASNSLSSLTVVRVLGLSCAAHGGCLLSDARVGGDGPALGEEKVPRVTVCYVANIAPFAEVGYV
jgi:hypothetical protein